MRPSCLCELINTGMRDGAKKQVICPCHPNNRSTPHHGAVYLFFWKVFVWYIGHEFLGGICRAIKAKAHEWHWVHTWSPWTQSGPAYPVAYPWTRAGCYAHFAADQTRHCEVCDLPQKQWKIIS